MTLTPGTRLGPYEIVAPLGAGGMGEVYRARDPRLGREVAVKVLPPDVASRPDRLARFEREAKTVAALNHPNIVTLHSIEEAGEIRFLTMELVEGQSLDRLVAPGGLPLERILELAIPLADALAAAHERGVVHRDLKPANVMVTREGRVKVLDFGLAKLEAGPLVGAGDTILAGSHLTLDGHVLGTAAYMSPEQAEGKPTDPRCDVFSLGILLYELATGKRPFQGGSTIAVLASVLTHRPASVSELRPDVPPELAGVVRKCLEKDPADRYESAAQLREELVRLQAGLGVGRAPAGTAGVAAAGAAGRARGETSQPTAASAPSAVQEAFTRREWETAHRMLCEIRETRPLIPEEMEMLATSALWLSRFDECIEVREQAFAAYDKAGRGAAAARVALELVRSYLQKNAGSLAQGWRKRAERLLENEPDCPERGYLLRFHALAALDEGDFPRALSIAQEARAIADRFGDADLRTLALHLQGRVLVAQGDVPAGTALVDEAMAGAVSGEVGPYTLGVLFCNTMSVCESLGDFGRAREWNDAAARWCSPDTTSPWPSVCRVHSARTMRQQGRWAEAEKAVRSACEALSSCGDAHGAAEAYNELGEMELRKGDFAAAESAFQKAHELGRDPVPGLPLLRLAQGKPEVAARMIDRALEEATSDRLDRAELLAARIAVALTGDEVPAAASAAEELMTIALSYGSTMHKAHALLGRGRVALARGDLAAATPALREAWSIFRDSGFPYDAARTRVHLGEAYSRAGNVDDARMQLEAAGKTFGELGAKGDVEVVAARIAGLAG